MSDTQTLNAELRNAWLLQARQHPLIAGGLLAALSALLALLLAGIANAFAAVEPLGLQRALLGGSAGFVATAGGALLAIGLGRVSQRSQDSMLGFAAGMMLAASAFSLILPGLAAAETILGSAPGAALVVVFGLGLGVLLMLGLDYFTPHEHASTGPCGPECERLNRVWLFVLAIALHNLPEGMAVGVGFAGGDLSVGLPLASAIAIQDIPEGLAVALALRSAGLAPGFSVLVAAGLRADGAARRAGRHRPVQRLRPGLPGRPGAGRRGDDLRGVPRGNPRDPPQRPPDPGDPRPDARLRGDDVPRHRAGLSMPAANLFRPLPDARGGERFDDLLNRPGCRIERIVSHGQASPPGFWYARTGTNGCCCSPATPCCDWTASRHRARWRRATTC